jgi:hypothetical protein
VAASGRGVASSAIDVKKRPALRIVPIHMTDSPGAEALPLTNTDRDVELGNDFPNCIVYAHMLNALILKSEDIGIR